MVEQVVPVSLDDGKRGGGLRERENGTADPCFRRDA